MNTPHTPNPLVAEDQSPPRRAYSYQRFSSPAQADGDSLRRQRSKAVTYAKMNNLVLDETSYRDLGVSAFRGKNVEIGALAMFRRAVEEGVIPPGSVLLVENLDRISRENYRKAASAFCEIVDLGVEVVTLEPLKRYTADALNDSFVEFITLIAEFERANKESVRKSQLISDAWDEARSEAYATGKPMTSRAPAWVELGDDGRFCLIPDRAMVVHRIYEMAVAGVGQQQIAARLNADSVPTFGDTGSKRRAEFWQRSYVKKILESPTSVGVVTPHKREWDADLKRYVRVGQPPIPGYYPAAVPEHLYDEVQAARGARRIATRTGSAIKNPFAALGRCNACGSAMTRVTKGSRSKAGRPYLVCTRAKAGGNCRYATVPLHLLTGALQWDGGLFAQIVPSNDAEIEVRIAEVARAASEAMLRASNLTESLANGPSPSLSAKLAEEEGAYRRLRRELEMLMIDAEGTTPFRLRERAERLGDLLTAGAPDWAAVNFALRQCFSEVRIDADRQLFEMKWRTGGTHTVAFGPKGTRHVACLYLGQEEGNRLVAAA